MIFILQAAAEQAAGAAAAAAAASQEPDGFHVPGLLLHMLPYLIMGVTVILAMNYSK
jgi:hypothetical protein